MVYSHYDKIQLFNRSENENLPNLPENDLNYYSFFIL